MAFRSGPETELHRLARACRLEMLKQRLMPSLKCFRTAGREGTKEPKGVKCGGELTFATRRVFLASRPHPPNDKVCVDWQSFHSLGAPGTSHTQQHSTCTAPSLPLPPTFSALFPSDPSPPVVTTLPLLPLPHSHLRGPPLPTLKCLMASPHSRRLPTSPPSPPRLLPIERSIPKPRPRHLGI